MYHLNSSSGLFISSNNSHFVEKLKKFCSDEQINRNFKFKFCPKPTSLPGISSSVSNCSPLCEDMNLYQILFAYLYPLLLILCIVGNVLNICVYMESHLRTSSTVRLLYAKALANISFLITLFPGLIKVYYPESAAVESFFWLSNPTAVFLANSFGGCATWLTVALTIDTFVCVAMPTKFKEICTMRLANIIIVASISCSVALQMFYPITREAKLIDCGNRVKRYQIRHRIYTDHQATLIYERIYHWANTILVIVVPFTLMAVLSMLILRKISCPKGTNLRGNRFCNLKKCVLRITFLTTVTHLLLECPQLGIYFAAVFRGNSHVTKDLASLDCSFAVATNFLSMTNAAVPFLLYFCSSRKFRRVLVSRIKRLPFWSENCRTSVFNSDIPTCLGQPSHLGYELQLNGNIVTRLSPRERTSLLTPISRSCALSQKGVE